MMKYLVFKTDGTMEVVETAGIMPLEHMQGIVGGYVEHTRNGAIINNVQVNLELFVNEMGWITEPPLPQNPFFPRLAGNAIAGALNEDGDFIGLAPVLLPEHPSFVKILVEAF